MTISPETAEPLPRLAALLHDMPPARLFEEVLKLLQAGMAARPHAAAGIQPVQPLFPTITLYFTERATADGADHQPGAEEYRYPHS